VKRFSALAQALLLAGCCGVNSIRTETLPDGVVGQPYSAQMTDNCEGRSSLNSTNWSLTGALPPGIRFSGEGRFSGTPTVAGAYPLTISVVAMGDSFNNIRETRSFTLTIRPTQ